MSGPTLGGVTAQAGATAAALHSLAHPCPNPLPPILAPRCPRALATPAHTQPRWPSAAGQGAATGQLERPRPGFRAPRGPRLAPGILLCSFWRARACTDRWRRLDALSAFGCGEPRASGGSLRADERLRFLKTRPRGVRRRRPERTRCGCPNAMAGPSCGVGNRYATASTSAVRSKSSTRPVPHLLPDPPSAGRGPGTPPPPPPPPHTAPLCWCACCTGDGPLSSTYRWTTRACCLACRGAARSSPTSLLSICRNTHRWGSSP